MQVLAITIPPEEDELFSSWIYRISKANLFENLDPFIRAFIRPKAPDGYQHLRYDDTEEFLTFYLALQSHTPMAELYLRTTCYAGLAPFMTSGQQIRRLNISFRRTYRKTEFTPKVTPYTRELRRCRCCQQEELENKGFWYYHRAHQLPGVRVCHKHGVLLDVFEGKRGHEFDEDNFFEPALPNADEKIMLRYAIFFKKILDDAPDGDLSHTKQAIRNMLHQLCYYNRGVIYGALNDDIELCGMRGLFPISMKQYMEDQFSTLSYPSMEQTMALVFFLFKTPEEFMKNLPISAYPEFQHRLDEGRYHLMGTFRNNLVHLQHACGTEFCTTAKGFASGWSCPKCDAGKTNQAVLDKLISYGGNNEYICQSEFEGIDKEITFLHNTCGRSFTKPLGRFLFEHQRCQCEWSSRKTALIERMNSAGSFRLLKYDSASDHLIVRHLKCNNSFECSYSYFMADMRCPHCENDVNPGLRPSINAELLRQRIAELVGDEYALVSSEVRKGTPVLIRHNVCGTIGTYYHGKFLIGQRCKECRQHYSDSSIRELIPYLSNGEYEILHIDSFQRCTIRQSKRNKTQTLQFEFILQEMTRPTPSSKLPCALPRRSIHDFVPTPTTQYEKILAHLRDTHRADDVLFREDFKKFGANKAQMNRIIKKLEKEKVLEIISPGIYKWSGSVISETDIIHQRYICRRGTQIGYLYGNSFAYELGLRKQRPERTYITTNKEARLHGREVSFLNHPLYLRGSFIPISDENWRILQLLDFLQCPMKYSDFSEKETEAVLRRHIRDNRLAQDEAEFYLCFYPNWVSIKLKKYCEDQL